METDRLLLRRWYPNDREPFRRINADARVMEFYPNVLTAKESDDIIDRAEQHFDKHGFGLYAVDLKESDVLLGFVGLQNVPITAHFTPAIEIGWRIAFEHWNKGYATEAAKVVLDFAFLKLNLPEVVALTFQGNRRSRRVMEKLDMTYDPKDDFDNPHPLLANTRLRPHVVYRKRTPVF